MKPRLLDLFCGAGGAAMGYARAGFEVVGVDINPQPHYPFEFVQMDAMAYPYSILAGDFDAVHASPPCQAHTLMRHLGKRAGEDAPDLIDATRAMLEADSTPWVMENVVGAPLRNPLILCGSAFGLGVRRHRLFESSHLIFRAPCNHDPAAWPVAVWGDGRPSRQEARREHRGAIASPSLTRQAARLAVARDAMGIDWMDWREITQAIPPAYTEWIGRQLLAAIERAA